MSFGERAALEGVLACLSPRLSIEIGTAEGGTLRRIAAHSAEVHSFDLVAPPPDVTRLANVRCHTGDSHELLPEFLAELAEGGRNVDLALVDGDHTSEGVRRDIEDLLDSPALSRAVMIVHDTANELVRQGIAMVDLDARANVIYVDMDFVAGYLFREPPGMRYQLWGGLGIVLVDSSSPRPAGESALQGRTWETAELLWEAKARLVRPSLGARALARIRRRKRTTETRASG